MAFVYSVIASLVLALLLAALARRVLGVPVGWPRSIVIGLMISGMSNPLVFYLLDRAGLMVDGTYTGTMLQGATYMVIPIAWVFALGLALLVISEVVIPTGSLPSPVAIITGWRPWRRRSKRYSRIMFIAVRHGLGRFLRIGGNRRTDELAGRAQTARALRNALNDGGVTFVKLGQMLSTRRDLLPDEFIVELSRLQSSADPLPWPRANAAIESALGRPIGDVFAHVDPEPLASASVGQVHDAEFLDGRKVVIKIQRPEAAAQVTADLDIIGRLATRLERIAPWARSIGLTRLVAGFAESLHEELDYTVELDNIRTVQAGMASLDNSIVEIPQVYPEWTSRRLLVMDKLEGVPVSRATEVLAELGDEAGTEMAGKLLAEILRQILITGVFHADLHPGNILIRSDGTIALLDFGSVGRLDSSSRTALGLLLLAIDRDDAIGATESLIQLLDRPDQLSERELERDIGQLMVRYRHGLGSQGSAGMFGSLLRLVSQYAFAVPPQVGAALRALGALEGTVTLISPRIDVVAAAREEGRDFVGSLNDEGAIRRNIEGELLKILPLLQRIPLRLNRISDDVENGRFLVNVRPLADPSDRRFLTSLVNQVTMTIIAAAVTLGAIMLLTSDAGPSMGGGLQLYAMFGYLLLFVGFVLGLRVLVLAFRRAWAE